MANKELKDNYYNCPSNIIDFISNNLNNYKEGGDTKGLKRAKGIVSNPKISYHQMKRLKNFFDNYSGDNKQEYILSGGDLMKKWVDNTLNNSRKNVDSVKRVQMNIGRENAFKKTHDKDRDNANPSNVNIPKIHKGSTRDQIMNNKVRYESLDKEINSINYLIEYMNNNKNKKLL